MDRYAKLFEGNLMISKDCPVIIENYSINKDNMTNAILFQTQFKNVSMKSIMAIEISLVCYDVMGNKLGVIPSFIYQDTIVSPGQSYGGNLVVMLNDPNTRQVDIICKRVVYVDREIWENANDELFVEPPQYENLLEDMDAKLADQLANYELKYIGLNLNYLLKPVSIGKLRRCVCGTYNYDNEQRCLGCNQSARFWDDITNPEYLKPRLDERLKLEEQQREEAERQRIELEKKQEEERKIREEKRKKRKKIFLKVVLPIIIVLALATAGVCSAFFYFIPKDHNDKGQEYMKNREFEKAYKEFDKAGGFASDDDYDKARLYSKIEPYEKKLDSYFNRVCKKEDILKIYLFPNAGKSLYYESLSPSEDEDCTNILYDFELSGIDSSAYYYYNAKYYLYCNCNAQAAWQEINKVENTKEFKDFDEVKKTIHDAVYWNGVRIHLTRAHLYDASRTLDLLIYKNDTYKAMKEYFKQRAVGKTRIQYSFFVCDGNEKSALGVEKTGAVGPYTAIKDKVKSQ